jgi:hypothetical protein
MASTMSRCTGRRSAMATVLMLSAFASDAAGEGAWGVLPAAVVRLDGVEIKPSSLPGHPRWLGLVCGPQGCELRAVDLVSMEASEPDKVRLVYERKNKNRPKGEFTVAVLSGAALRAGQAVPTWFTLRTPVTVRVPEQPPYRVLPRWNRQTQELPLYLEHAGQRQRLGAASREVLRNNNGIRASDLLVWAGDLDGDGRLDAITRVSPDNGAGLHLWLSSRAAAGQMMGLAASLDSWGDVMEAEGC